MAERRVDVAIIGAGTAGLTAYRRVREHTDSVVLIEGGPHGTTCARVGCMPSKLLIAAAAAAQAVREAPVFGIEAGPPRVDGRAVMRRVRELRDDFVRSVLVVVEDFPPEHRLDGYARFLDPHRLQVGDDTVVEAGRIVIATGSRPTYPGFFAKAGDLLATSDDVFEWEDLPGSVAVFGGGIVGLELGQALHRLGVRMRLFGKDGAVGPLGDPAALDYAARTFAAEFPFDPDARVSAIRRRDGQVEIVFEEGGEERTERFDRLLAATGRRPNVDRLGLENSGLELDERGVPVFDRFTGQCGDSHVFIAGDANDDAPLLHEASDEGKIAGDNAGRYPDVRAQTRRAPLGIVFCDPQIAIAGKSWRELQDEGADCAIGEVSFEDQGRSRVVNENRGLLRVYGAHGSGLFLGAEMIGPAAEHIGHLLAWAAQQALSVHEMLAMPYYHPVIEEGLRTALRRLNRQLRMGPELVPQCLDCGPGG